MIKAQFKIVRQTQREGQDYPDNHTVAEFNIEAEDDHAIAVFQQALADLTTPTDKTDPADQTA